MRRFFIGSIVMVAVVLATFAWGSIAQAQTPLTPDQQAAIKANCVSIKASLTQLHVSDALLRVNRGQVYESMASNLMDNFNTRLANNGLDNKAMTTVTTSYENTLNTFRSDYIAYEQKLSDALKVDCSQDPTTFYNTVEAARALRSKVHDDVQKLSRALDDYRSSLGDFLLNYERVSQ